MCDFSLKPGGSVESCKCRAAVLKAYNELRVEHELPEPFALEAAYIVYKHHHPEDKPDMARLKVESWIHAGHLH